MLTPEIELDAAKAQAEFLQRENARLRKWINDLQACLYVNCVYCGHRYGPMEKKIPQDVLKEHIEKCPEHPLCAAREEIEQLRVQLAGCLTAAEGGTNDPAVQGQYGWSLAYQRTLDLRIDRDRLRNALLVARGFIQPVRGEDPPRDTIDLALKETA